MGKDILVVSRKFQEYAATKLDFVAGRGCTFVEREIIHPLTEDHLCELVQDVDGIVTGLEAYTPRVFEHANRLKVITAGGVGYDHIDVAAATERGVAVCICAGCNNHGVAELAFGMMIGLARRIIPLDRGMRAGQWGPAFQGPDLWGKTLGVVGLGRVGKSTALLGRAFGMRVLATDIDWDLTFANEHGISHVPLDTLLAESDFVSLHVPLTSETRGLINERTIDLMKPSAFLINTARGPVVEEAALVDALRAQRIAGAGLDVFEVEPRVPNPYVDLDNVILTPHIGGSTRDAFDRAFHLALTNVTNVLNGLPAHCQVN